jgi:hypothetical protein
MKYKHSKEKQKEVLKKYAGGGAIKNQYKGRTAKNVWDNWNMEQKFHFLKDHFLTNTDYSEDKKEQVRDAKYLNWNNLPRMVQMEVERHVFMGQYANGGYADKGVYVETLDEEIDLSDDGKPRVKRTQEGSNKSFRELREIHGASPEALAYAEGGSLGNHGLKEGDQIIKTMSGGVQKVKTKSGDIVYVNLANGYRGDVPPLPFDKGGRTRERKYVNYSQKHEVRYSKNKPHRRGYGYAEGGEVESNVIWNLLHKEQKLNFITKNKTEIEKNIELNQEIIKESIKNDNWDSLNENIKNVFNKHIKNKKFHFENIGKEVTWEDFKGKKREGIIDSIDFNGNYIISNEYSSPSILSPDEVNIKDKSKNKFWLFAGGGKTTFKEKATAIAKNFEGKKVEPKYQKEYGKTYDKAEAKEVGNKIAGSQKAKYDSKMSGGGSTTKRGGAMVLAKQIRKDGESWQSALKRANDQMKKK